MEALDGNAIGGLLADVFGADMTAATGTCARCGTASVVAEFAVYLNAPGTVVRCPTCGSVIIVIIQAHGMTCTDLSGLAGMQ